jgi:hypothetical protein
MSVVEILVAISGREFRMGLFAEGKVISEISENENGLAPIYTGFRVAMPLSICRCCGEKMEPEEHGRNPNVCSSCERLLEDESPTVIAQIPDIDPTDDEKLLDDPESRPQVKPKPAKAPSPDSKTSRR